MQTKGQISILVMNSSCAYNKSTSIGFPFGSIKRLDKYESGAVSTLYICFALNGNKCDSEYIKHYFDAQKWNKEVAMICAEGSRNHGLLNIPVDDFFDTLHYIPESLSEQQKIADFLSAYDKKISLQRERVETLKEQKKGLLQKMFPKKGETVPELRFPGFTGDWEQRKLGEISDSYSGGTPTVGIKEYYGGQIPFIRSGEINSDYTELFITKDGLKNSSARLVSKGDILYALYGATSGEVGRARLNGAINQAILAIKPSAGYDCEFISQWLRKNKQNIVETYLQGGQGNLSGTIVKDLVVQFPTLPEQEVIGTCFASLDNLIALHQRKLETMQEIKKGLLQQMFV